MATNTKHAKEHILGLDEIDAKASKFAIEKIYVAKWGGAVLIREMSAAERSEMEIKYITAKGGGEGKPMTTLRAEVVVRSLCKEDGTLMFQDIDAGIKKVTGWGSSGVEVVFEAASKLSRLSNKDVAELVGN